MLEILGVRIKVPSYRNFIANYRKVTKVNRRVSSRHNFKIRLATKINHRLA